MQVMQLQQSNAALVGRLNMAEQERRNMYSRLSMLRDKCAEATAENSALQREVAAAHAAVAVRGSGPRAYGLGLRAIFEA